MTRNKFTMEEAERELVADFVGDVLLQGDNIELADKALNELAETHRNLLQRLIDWVKELISKLRHEPQNRTLTQDLEYLNERLARVYDSAIKNTAENSGEKWSININAKSEVHKALYDKNYRNEVLLRDNTPDIMLSQKGVRNIPMVMKASHIRENVFTEEAKKLGLKIDDSTHYHGLGEKYFIQIIDGLDNTKEAYRGTKNANMPSRRENYFLLVSEFKDENGNEINVPVYIEEDAQCNRVFLKGNKIATVFGRDDFRNYINKQIKAGNLVRIKNKSGKSSEGGVPLTPAYRNTTLNNNISNPEEKVKESFSIRKVTPLSDPKKYANKILRRNRSRQDAGVLAEQLKKISEAAQQSDYAAAWNLAKEAAQGVIDSSKNLEMLADDAIELLEDIRNSAIKLNSAQKSEAVYAYGTYNDFRKRNMGRIKLRQDGLPLDIKWQVWAETYPHIFDSETNDTDMPLALVNIIDSLKSTYVDYNISAATESLASQIFTEVISAKEGQFSEELQQAMKDLQKKSS